ncbi:myosin-11-like [Cucurbita maxima]|uniref:Myosin-11-like n=1 Tax=Cucurbita maxima TaxID=3661 RepID=A0A6J1IZ56_CUCMA|nr:myosin-11-like [Cucurbita maxima]
MFKSARWRSEKNRIKAEFKLRFCATQIPEFGGDSLMISVVPGDVGKPTLRLEKATVRGGKCRWENAAYVTVKFDADQKTGKFIEKLLHFRVSTGLTRPGLLGDVSIDFAKYAEATKPFSASLPLQNSNSAVLHIWIQRIQEDGEQRDLEEFEGLKSRSQHESLSSYLNNEYINKNNYTEDGLSDEAEKNGEVNGELSSSESSSGLDSPIENGITKNIHQQPNGFVSPLSHAPVSRKPTSHEEDQTLAWKWSTQSDHILTTDDLRAVLEEMRQELNYEKDLNGNLRLQVQKTQESNTKLILTVQDLEEILDEKNCEISDLYTELNSKKAEYSDALDAIRELESHGRSLEEELEKQGEDFEAELEAMILSKVEQEQRAIRAEEALRKLRSRNARTAERVQGEFGRVSKQMVCAFEANEKVAMKAVAEASEVRSQRSRLEEALQNANEEIRSVRESYEEKLETMESEVKDMQERYSEISLRFAEVEGERQRLVMTVRNLRNANRN